ncbi:hypothetical protein [Thermodesulfatator autotrophicus]|uniref:Uncharacterized protein n=1 Tax=Thermodesulfatator autotrophicus TaxID=1795632 RepID=A0A177EAZ3_9BACT|nr:hypothetical protein [Thermodesulfatator autotrophicus]OAG28352.1 hypothetical protein TH606_01885 [Thermodesulfatator autotrophicus]
MRFLGTRFLFMVLLVGFLLLGLGVKAKATPFQNGDFETGDFTGWSGELIDININTVYVDPDSDSHFTLFKSSDLNFDWVAEISLDDTYWQSTLYQDFTLDSLNSGLHHGHHLLDPVGSHGQRL